MYTVYKHTNKINGKIYIGLTSRDPQKRWGVNGNKYKNSPHFYSAILKYGWENFKHDILSEGLTREEASKKEREYIKFFNSNNRNFGYNSTSGGELSFEMTEEIRAKMSLAMMGNTNGCHPCSEETKQKIRDAEKGRPLSEEHKKKLKEAAQNRISPPCSEETKEKLRERHPAMKKIYCLETDTVYKSIHECARVLGLEATNICAVCKGKHKAYKGYHFNYIDNI